MEKFKFMVKFKETQLVSLDSLDGKENKNLTFEVDAISYALVLASDVTEIKDNFAKGKLDNFEFGIEPDIYPNGECVLDVFDIINRKISGIVQVRDENIQKALIEDKPKKININGAFADCINNIIHFNDKELPDWMETKEIILDNDSKKEEIIDLLDKCESYSIKDDSICFIVKRTQQEIDNYFKDSNESLEYEINKLQTWFNSKDEYKEQIKNYLLFRKLDWILEKINHTDVKESALDKIVSNYDNLIKKEDILYAKALISKYDSLIENNIECDIYLSSQAGYYFVSKETILKEIESSNDMDIKSLAISDKNGKCIFDKNIFLAQENSLKNTFENEEIKPKSNVRKQR